MKRNLVYSLLAIVFCVFSGMPVNAQLGTYWEPGRIAITPTSDGGFYLFGIPWGSITGPSGDILGFLAKYDNTYNRVDLKEIYTGASINPPIARVGNLVEDGNGKILFTIDHEKGFGFTPFSPNYNLGGQGGTVVKLDPPDDILALDKDTTISNFPNFQNVRSSGIMPLDSGGGFYCLKEWRGSSYGTGNLPMIPSSLGTAGYKQTVLIKYNEAGEAVWMRNNRYLDSITLGTDGLDPILWSLGDSGQIYLKGSLSAGKTSEFIGTSLVITAPQNDFIYIAAIDSNGNGKWIVEEFAQNPRMNNAKSYHAIPAGNGDIYTTVSRPGYSATNTFEYLVTRGVPGMPIRDSLVFEQPQSNAQQGGFRELKMLDNGNLRVFGMFRDSLVIDSTIWLSAAGERCFVAEMDTGLNMVSACLLDTFFAFDEGEVSIGGDGTIFYVKNRLPWDNYKTAIAYDSNCNLVYREDFYFSLVNTQDSLAGISLKLFPNPAIDQINFELEAPTPGVYKVRIFNLLGQEMSSREMMANSTRLQNTLDISQLSKGSYFLSVEKEGQVFTRGFVKQ